MGCHEGRSGGCGTGRKKLNPDNCIQITRKAVIDLANKLGLEIKRDGLGMWFYKRNGEWWNLGQTNLLVYNRLNECLSYINGSNWIDPLIVFVLARMKDKQSQLRK